MIAMLAGKLRVSLLPLMKVLLNAPRNHYSICFAHNTVAGILLMTRKLSVASQSWPLKQTFRIARGAKNEAVVVVATIDDGNHSGRGECVPYARYGETVASVTGQIEKLRRRVETGISRQDLQTLLPAGAARNALDCAMIDLEAKM